MVPGSGITVRLKASKPAKSAGKPGGLAVESPGVRPITLDIPLTEGCIKGVSTRPGFHLKEASTVESNINNTTLEVASLFACIEGNRAANCGQVVSRCASIQLGKTTFKLGTIRIS